MKQKIEVHIKVRINITIFYNISGSKTVTQGSESVSYFETTEKNISKKFASSIRFFLTDCILRKVRYYKL